MAGMLPGVEAARRRRFHHTSATNHSHSQTTSSSSSSSGCCTRRSSAFCLYAIRGYLTFNSSTTTTTTTKGTLISSSSNDESGSELCGAAREAKKRLDQRLHILHLHTSSNSQPESFAESKAASYLGRPLLIPKAKKKKNWLNLTRWKSSASSEQEECAVCLELLQGGGRGNTTVMQVPCGHRFHTECLMPWLEGRGNAHCPCCRMEIST
ncbi:probable E3 ubiquitin-protein ligase RHY1A isoform X2 [Andrographis paniculata]|uniref:probable E3 ubiquitin-protein ligase RHY1A isoform X2 n=1 Tax=Andrographis paniculata TaxID=175694 RepID=UPI0021E6EE43|nr:probable E3 ubiquitin-protein ligase RHY1A isoform X2 [Andrographis paniculata]